MKKVGLNQSLMMDGLPHPLIIEILSRLDDSADIARCRVACKTFNVLSREVRFINLRCSSDRFIKYISPLKKSSLTPFKNIFKTLISELRIVESVSISVDDPPTPLSVSDEFQSMKKDFQMSDTRFLKEWLPGVCDGLRSLSISNCWTLSGKVKSRMLSLVSAHCHNLMELQITDTCLSVDGLRLMPKLSKLTLKDIKLLDKNLRMVNQCFPALQVLNLSRVSGLREPKICFLNLKSCQLSLYDSAHHVTIVAPKLTELKLECECPETLTIETPSLTDLYLSLQSSVLHRLLSTLPFDFETIKDLTLDSIKLAKPFKVAKFGLDLLFTSFPNVSSLTLSPWVWSEMEMYVYPENLQVRINKMKGLKEISGYLEIRDLETTLSFIFYILDNCSNLSDIKLFIHSNVGVDITLELMSRCMRRCSRVRWSWGTWKGTKNAWVQHTCVTFG